MPTGRQYFAECREVDGMLCGASEDETAFGVWLESLLGRSSREHSGQDGGDVNPSAAANSSRFTVTPAPCLDAMGKKRPVWREPHAFRGDEIVPDFATVPLRSA